MFVLLPRQYDFDELRFLAEVKARPGMYFGRPSLQSLADQLWGMEYAFSYCTDESPIKYFWLFTKWYEKEVVKDQGTYASWYNHMMYHSGCRDDLAFEYFFHHFERYLRDVHNLCLPEPTPLKRGK